MNAEALADEVRTELKRDRLSAQREDRLDMLASCRTWDEKVELIVAHLRIQGRRETAPARWYR
jgi:hypothetical protein